MLQLVSRLTLAWWGGAKRLARAARSVAGDDGVLEPPACSPRRTAGCGLRRITVFTLIYAAHVPRSSWCSPPAAGACRVTGAGAKRRPARPATPFSAARDGCSATVPLLSSPRATTDDRSRHWVSTSLAAACGSAARCWRCDKLDALRPLAVIGFRVQAAALLVLAVPIASQRGDREPRRGRALAIAFALTWARAEIRASARAGVATWRLRRASPGAVGDPPRRRVAARDAHACSARALTDRWSRRGRSRLVGQRVAWSINRRGRTNRTRSDRLKGSGVDHRPRRALVFIVGVDPLAAAARGDARDRRADVVAAAAGRLRRRRASAGSTSSRRRSSAVATAKWVIIDIARRAASPGWAAACALRRAQPASTGMGLLISATMLGVVRGAAARRGRALLSDRRRDDRDRTPLASIVMLVADGADRRSRSTLDIDRVVERRRGGRRCSTAGRCGR